MILPSLRAFLLKGAAWFGSQLRASNEALLRARVPRAGGRPGCPSLPLRARRAPGHSFPILPVAELLAVTKYVHYSS